MSLKTILVHVDDTAHRAARVSAAVELARSFGARLIGMYAVPTEQVTPSIAALLPPGVVDEHLRSAGRAQHEAEAVFRKLAAAASIGACCVYPTGRRTVPADVL